MRQLVAMLSPLTHKLVAIEFSLLLHFVSKHLPIESETIAKHVEESAEQRADYSVAS